jgi:Mg-chelatase subunit ChlD
VTMIGSRALPAVLVVPIAVAAAIAGLGLAARPARTVAGVAQGPAAGQCVASYDKRAAESVAAGEAAWVRASLRVSCGAITAPLHVVLAQDGSTAMSGTLKTDMHNQAVKIVRGLHLGTNPTTQVASVEFNEKAKRLIGLTNDEAAAVIAVQRSGARGKTMIEVGIDEAAQVIEEGRAAMGHPPDLTDVLLVLANGRNDKGCSAAVDAANKAKAKNILLIVSCVSADCEVDCLRQVASSPRYFYFAENVDNLIDALQRAQRLVPVRVTDLRITDRLAMPYVRDSGEPPPSSVSPDGKELFWQSDSLPLEGITLTYLVDPGRQPGLYPVSFESRAVYTNSVGESAGIEFPVPMVRVREETPVATDTATVAPTETRPPEDTPTAEPTAEPTVTPTGALPGCAIYVPVVARDAELGAGER